MTLGEMREELVALIRYDGDYRDDTPVSRYNRLLNLAYVEACRVCELPEEVRSVSVGVGERRVALPVVMVYRAWWGELPLRREVLVESRLVSSGTPCFYEQVGRGVVLYPIPSEGGTLVVEGVWEPELLVGDGDAPLLPASAHRAIVKLAYAYYLDTLGLSKQELRMVHEREARGLLEETLRALRVSRWGDSRRDVYRVPWWLREYE